MGRLNLVTFVDMTHTYNTLVVVDDNAAILTALKICLAAEFERIVTLTSPDTLVATLAKEEAVDAVLLDMNFSLGVNTGQDGLFWLRTIKKLHPNTPVILITAYADVQLAVKGLKYGAAFYARVVYIVYVAAYCDVLGIDSSSLKHGMLYDLYR